MDDKKDTYEEVLDRYFPKASLPQQFHVCNQNASCVVCRELLEEMICSSDEEDIKEDKTVVEPVKKKKKKNTQSTNTSYKQVECSVCLRVVRSNNLKRHMKRKDHTITLREELIRICRINEQIIKQEMTEHESIRKLLYPDFHLKYTNSHKRLMYDEFQFESFITGNHRYLSTTQIGEDLTTARELDRPCYDELAVSILNNNDRIVGHLPPQISEQCTLLLKSGGTVMVKVTANPVDTKTHGIRIPCTYIISGKESFVQDIKDNVDKIF